MWLAFGAAAIVAAAAIAFVCIRLGKLLASADESVTKINRQLDEAREPLGKTLGHVSGLAQHVDGIVAKADHVADAADKAATAVAAAAESTQAAMSPTLASLVGIVAGVSQGARTFFRTRGRNGASDDR
jgi:uncharacterized protein YoxC